MKDFLLQVHYPVILVKRDDDSTYNITQITTDLGDNTTWNIPLFVWDSNSQEVHLIWFLKDGTFCSNDHFKLDSQQIYIFNHKALSFLRVYYSDALIKELMTLDSRLIDESTQLSLFYDRMEQEFCLITDPDCFGVQNFDDEDPLSTQLLRTFIKKSRGRVSPFIVQYIWKRVRSK
jgi:aminopeptidase N